jgi:polysaccharide chain length determinant protein (PEP-CTERM system associated)
MQENTPDLPNIADYAGILRRRKWSLVLPMAIVLALAAVTAILLPTIYRSSATILIEEQEIPTDFVTATVTSYAEQRLQQINQRIMSTSRLLEVIEQFDLYAKLRKRRTTEEVIERMRTDVKLRQISAEVVDRRTGRPTTATIAFSLSFEGHETPLTVQRVANVLVSLFLQENLQVRERQTADTSKFLEDELERVKGELAVVERKLSDYKEIHMNSLPEMIQLNVQAVSSAERNLERLDEQLRSGKEREGYLQAQLANVAPFLENTDRKALEQRETELATLRSRLSEDHPDVVKTQMEVIALKDKIADNSRTRKIDPSEPDNPAYITLASQLASARSEIASIVNQMAEQNRVRKQYEQRIESTPKVEREYKLLTTDQANLKGKFDDLTRKVMEAKVAHGLEKGQKGERFTLIDPPRLPERPAKPNRMAIMIIGLVLGLGAGIGYTALREFSDHSVHDGRALAFGTGLPVLGEIPVIVTQQDLRDRRTRRIFSLSVATIALIAGTFVFHFWIMDLNVFWAKLIRLIPT